MACCELAWEAPPPPSALRCDVVVASDVLYDPGGAGHGHGGRSTTVNWFLGDLQLMANQREGWDVHRRQAFPFTVSFVGVKRSPQKCFTGKPCAVKALTGRAQHAQIVSPCLAVVVPVLVGLLVKLLGRAPAPAGAAGDEAQAAAADAADAAAGERSTTEAFIASTLRNPQTMELFLRTAAGSGLRVEDVGTGDGGEEGPGAGAGAGSRRVRFHHVPGLELAEKRILIHRVTMGL